MQEGSSRLNVIAERDIRVIELRDRKLLDEVNIGQIGQELEQHIAPLERPRIVLDFTGVDYMSSSALGMLITFSKRVLDKDGQLKFCCINSKIYEVFTITKLDGVFQIFETRKDALNALE